jgi:hypothetical protein
MSCTGEAEIYQIKVAGGLDQTWSDWLGGMEIVTESGRQGTTITILTGRLADQATLRGILSRIWDLNLKVISVHPMEPPEQELEK